MFRPLAERLSVSLGCAVELKTAGDFAQFWQGVARREYDLVHYNQYHYIKSALDYEVVAHNVEGEDGRMYGAVFVRADSGIEQLGDLAGKKIIFGGGPDAMMSHIIPRYLLLEAGLKPDQYSWEYAPNPPNAIMAVYYSQAQAAGGGNAVLRVPVLARSIDTEQLRIIARSESVEQLPWSVRRSLPRTLKKRIQASLLSLPESKEGRAELAMAGMTGIKPAKDADYDNCRAIVHKLQTVFPLD
jgi:phosphonate transport system substrate-binding protein